MKAIALHTPGGFQNALYDIDRYFESFFGEPSFNPAAKVFGRIPAADVRETEKAYIVEMELPGFDKKDIEVHVDGGKLSVASKQEAVENTNSEEEGRWIIRERRRASFSRSFKIPQNADAETITADFKNAVLRLEINKKPDAQKRSIEIRA